jgi:pyruvate-ferredoxin/flavodoxin oxidoreductase
VQRRQVTVEGNEAAAYVAHQCNEVIAIYPITPASGMGELADAWSAAKRANIYGTVPDVIEMQSEAGAAGTVHGALQAGALSTTFTASQGLLLMIPNMFKIAGELTPTVFHIAARSVATHALSIFGEHSDVMAARSTGWAMLASASVQEAQDMALISQAATLESRVPFLHFFDGFRTSHEVNKIEQVTPDDIRAMIDERWVQAHRERSLSPERPVLRGSAQNPDVYFQAREAVNPFYLAVPELVQRTLNRFAGLVGRQYRLFDYVGASDAERVAVVIGSAAGAFEETVEVLLGRGEKVGLLKVRLYRPFDASAFVAALPSTTRTIAVLERTKEPGALGEPLYMDVVTALVESWSECNTGRETSPRVIGGRYGLASKEFTPSMAAAVYSELSSPQPKRHFTVGITDDVTHLSLKYDPTFSTERPDVLRAVFYGFGSDGTVGANKNSVKIIGENTSLFAQGYFVYDSKKSGSTTVSHLRFSPRPINSSYVVSQANFVACHQWSFLERGDALGVAETGATFLLNSPYGPDEVWAQLPSDIQRQIVDKKLKFYVVDALSVAREAGLGGRINTVMQTCFFALAGILPREDAIGRIKESISKTYGKRGQTVLERNFAAVDGALSSLHEVVVPKEVAGKPSWRLEIADSAPDFVKRVTRLLIEGKGDLLPVSALPVDGTFPTGTTRFEKRSIAQEIPIWDADICIECGLCALVCPHATIRTKAYDVTALEGAPEGFCSKPWTGKELPGHRMTVQVAPDDCTGCGICVDVCPAISKSAVKHKAINMRPKLEHLEREQANWEFFLGIPDLDRTRSKIETVKGSQLLLPLFEYSGACSGCGETPYLKLMSQLFGDRAMIANATGCTSIYGGNLPTTPWAQNTDGRGPTWSNSLFEDAAEFGLGFRLAVNQQQEYAQYLLKSLAAEVGDALVDAILENRQETEAELAAQRNNIAALKSRLSVLERSGHIDQLLPVADALLRRSVWIVGGDGWAYDIGFGGLDHVLASGRDVNILVLDTEVYSNTGGQASKSTPRAAVAKFASGGKAIGKKDLGMIAVDYGNVYVAQVAMGGNPLQTLKAFEEAESYRGPSLILAYSHCIAHGCEMSTAMTHQKEAVASGYWPLYRYDPRLGGQGKHPFHLDSHKPTLPLRAFALKEARYAMLARANPEHAEQLLSQAQRDVDSRWRFYEQMAGVERAAPGEVELNQAKASEVKS